MICYYYNTIIVMKLIKECYASQLNTKDRPKNGIYLGSIKFRLDEGQCVDVQITEKQYSILLVCRES